MTSIGYMVHALGQGTIQEITLCLRLNFEITNEKGCKVYIFVHYLGEGYQMKYTTEYKMSKGLYKLVSIDNLS